LGIGSVLASQLVGAERHASAQPTTGPATRRIVFDGSWLFGPLVQGGTTPGFDDSKMAKVTLPHTVTPLSWREWDPVSWESVWLYRKHFDAPTGSRGMRVFVDFAGALTWSRLTLNGHRLPGSVGGYLPFSAELTARLQPHGNVLAVVLDSRFQVDVPPDRRAPNASSSVDFWQPGGVYRDVQLRVVPQVFIADMFAKPIHVLNSRRRSVEIEFSLDAAHVPKGAVTIRFDLWDRSRRLASTTVPVVVIAGRVGGRARLDRVGSVVLWDIENPKLYDVVATLFIDGKAIHDYRTRIGFREAHFAKDGFFLNGRRVKLFGVNRHQFFPFAGGALPGRVQRRDAQILRQELNCNFVRSSHCPQAEEFYEACDELGMLVWEEIPGWGYFGDTTWQAAAQRDLVKMIVRDRNHPSIVVWGVMPNESGNHPRQYEAWNTLAHSLDDSRPTGGDDSDFGSAASGFEFDVYSHHDYSHHTGPDGRQVPNLRPPSDPASKPYLVCEAVGTLSGPARYYRRTDPQWVQQGQATAHARVHEIAHSDNRYCGLAAWSGYDYESGTGNQYQGVKYTGVVDVFRVPKPGAAIYRAQVNPKVRPVIASAFYWDFGATSPINQLGPAMICSNLDRLEVYVAGRHFSTARPDTTEYGHLPHPPSFVDFSAVDGADLPELRIDGYLGSAKLASESYSADPTGDRLLLTVDDHELVADGSDATRVAFRAVDKHGKPRPYVTGDVTLSITGPAVLVGDNPFAFADAGGVGAVWLRTRRNSPGDVTVTAQHPALGPASATIKIS
jgi:beta-galactosidase